MSDNAARNWSRTICLCSPTYQPIKSLIQGDEWIMEEKYDGDRVILVVDDNDVRAYGRRNALALPRPVRRADWSGLTAIFDGEMLGDCYMVFDILSLRGVSSIDVPLRTRKQILNTLAPYLPPTVKVVPFAKTERDKLSLLRAAVEADKEGVVVKQFDSVYEPGRHASWQKLKFYKALEAVVLSIGEPDGSHPEAARVGLYFKPVSGPELREVCGLKIPMKYQLRDKVQVGDVVEVRYLAVGSNYRLIQPVYMRKRLDKAATECYANQISDSTTSLPYYMGEPPVE